MMNLYEMNAETRREVERMVDALVDNTLADEGTASGTRWTSTSRTST